MAIEVADAMQGNGLGTILLGQLAEAANQLGVQVLDAEVLAENHQMVRVFRDCGFPVKTHTVPGVLLIEFPTSLSPEALERFERREPTFPLLEGYRGAPRADVAALEDLLLRVSAMVEAHPEITELDCNPVKALPDGAVVVDARVRVRDHA